MARTGSNRGSSARQYFKKYCEHLGEIMAGLDFAAIEAVVKLLLEKSRKGQAIFFLGNGGSAATASHFATDLTQCGDSGLCFRAISLTDNAPLFTALGNDRGYAEVFTGQMRNLFRKGDMLVAISASGNSPNVLAAVHMAKKLGGVTVGLVGFDGGQLAGICDHVIHVSTGKGEYGPVEDAHLIVNHMIATYLCAKRGKKG